MSLLFLNRPPILPPYLRQKCGGMWDAPEADPNDMTKWRDISGNGRDMTMSNFAGTPQSGLVLSRPEYWQFDGVDDYAEYSSDTDINPVHTSFSAVCIFRVSETSSSKYLIRPMGDASAAMSISVSGGNLSVVLFDTGGGSVAATTPAEANKMTCLCASYDQSIRKVRIFNAGNFAAISEAIANGILKINCIYSGRNSDGTALSQQSVGMIAIFPGCVLSDQDVYRIWRANHARFGI